MTGAETWGTAMDGARWVRVHAMGAETWGTAADGARVGAETWGAQRGGMWAHVRGVDTCNGNVCPEGPRLCVAHARRPRTRVVPHIEAAASGETGDGT